MKKIYFILILSVFFLSAFPQQSIKLSQLVNTSWIHTMKASKGYSDKLSFVKSSVENETVYVFYNLKREHQRKVYSQSCPFYLSNNVPDEFDSSKEGKVKRGRYLVIKVKSGFECFEVISFSSQLLCIKPAYPKTREVIGIPEIIRYVRIN